MRKNIMFCILYVLFILLSCNCFAEEIGSSALLNNTKEYDGKTVIYKGEVIGDIMMRGDYAWIHVNDGNIAIGIWAPKNLVQHISYAGNYKNKGDVVEVYGVFHRSCLEHGGDLDIHAQAIKVLATGADIKEEINKKKVYIGLASLLILLLFYLISKFL